MVLDAFNELTKHGHQPLDTLAPKNSGRMAVMTPYKYKKVCLYE